MDGVQYASLSTLGVICFVLARLVISGVARNYVYGGRPERRMLEGRGAKGTEWG